MFEGKFECIGENIEKYKTFFVLIKKEVTNTDKDRNESIVTISYKIKIIDSARIIAIAVLNLVDNLRQRIHRIKYKECDFFLEYESVKDIVIKYKRLTCNKDYSNKIDGELKNRFKSTFNFLIMILINLFY